MNKIEELQSEINEIKKFINNDKTPADEKKMYGDMVSEMEKELDKLKSESSSKKDDDKKKSNETKKSDEMKKHTYKLGDIYRSDFDYEGALKYVLKLTPETDIKTIQKLAKSLEDVNYHSIARPLYRYEESIKENKKNLSKLDEARNSAYENLLEDGVKVDKPNPFFKEEKPKSTPKSTSKKTSTKKVKTMKGLKVISANKVNIDGKEVDMDSSDFCDYLLKKFKERRNKAKSSSTKKKTPSVMERIASSIERTVTQALKTNVKDNDAEYTKNPTFFLKRVNQLETATKNFLHSMKDVLGDEYDESEVSDAIKSIEELSKKIIEKYKKK